MTILYYNILNLARDRRPCSAPSRRLRHTARDTHTWWIGITFFLGHGLWLWYTKIYAKTTAPPSGLGIPAVFRMSGDIGQERGFPHFLSSCIWCRVVCEYGVDSKLDLYHKIQQSRNGERLQRTPQFLQYPPSILGELQQEPQRWDLAQSFFFGGGEVRSNSRVNRLLRQKSVSSG